MTAEQQELLIKATHAYLEQNWTAEQKQFLQELIAEDSEARALVADLLSDHAAMYWYKMESEHDGALLQELVERDNYARSSRRPSLGSLLALASCLLIGGLLFWHWNSNTEPDSIAVVHAMTGEGSTKGAVAESSLVAGSILSAGDSLTLTEGLVELNFSDSGVYLVGNAPLDLTVMDDGKVFLHEGEIKLHVPPQGIGFIVETKERKITDLGTSFVVTANKNGSRVLVLDGEISIDEANGTNDRLMNKGDLAEFSTQGEAKYSQKPRTKIPVHQFSVVGASNPRYKGRFFYYQGKREPGTPAHSSEDTIGLAFSDFVSAGFSQDALPEEVLGGKLVKFEGIAGSVGGVQELTNRNGERLTKNGWMIWYHGMVSPPKSGRYRFWGYADNNLMVSLDQRLVLNGSRYGSKLGTNVACYRQSFPSYPCLNAKAGLSCGEWIYLEAGQPVRLDILLGESGNPHTAGLLMVEHEGGQYEETYWGQPRYPLFLTEKPSAKRLKEFEETRRILERDLKGAFSVKPEYHWQVIRE